MGFLPRPHTEGQAVKSEGLGVHTDVLQQPRSWPLLSRRARQAGGPSGLSFSCHLGHFAQDGYGIGSLPVEASPVGAAFPLLTLGEGGGVATGAGSQDRVPVL